MEFAWNTQKNGMNDIKGLEKEQDREGKISNKEIDLEKTKLNYDLVQSELNLYQRVKQRVEEVKPVSRVQKNSVVDYSNIITVPQEQFKEWGVERSKEYLKEVYDYFCKEFGKENVVSAKVHLDETTPHMHLHFVPVSEEGKLQARKVMTPQRINKIHTEAPKYLQEMGFDVFRGKGKTDKSLEIKEFKAEKLQEKINDLEKALAEANERHKSTVEQLKQEQDKVKEQFKRLTEASEKLSKGGKDVKGISDKLRQINPSKAFGGKLKLTNEEYSILISLANQGGKKIKENIVLQSNVNTLKRKIGELENEQNRKSMYEEINRIKFKDYDKIKRENKELKQSFERVEEAINNLDLLDKVNSEIKKIQSMEREKSFNRDR